MTRLTAVRRTQGDHQALNDGEVFASPRTLAFTEVPVGVQAFPGTAESAGFRSEREDLGGRVPGELLLHLPLRGAEPVSGSAERGDQGAPQGVAAASGPRSPLGPGPDGLFGFTAGDIPEPLSDDRGRPAHPVGRAEHGRRQEMGDRS